jgi:hypothetical protein
VVVIELSDNDEVEQQGQSRSQFISLVARSSAPPQKGRAQEYHKWTKEDKVLAVEEVRQTGGAWLPSGSSTVRKKIVGVCW